MSILKDSSPMPYGEHVGTPMEDLPTAYLDYLLEDYGSQPMDTIKPIHLVVLHWVRNHKKKPSQKGSQS